MKNEEIKQECELMYSKIESAQERLKELRSICKHENTFDGNYSYRVGVIQPAIFCSHCNSLIKIKNELNNFEL